MHRLIAIVLTYNEAEHITACLEALRFADARLVFDSGSTDNTQALAKQAGAEVMVRPFDNYTGQRNAALEAVKDRAEWVLFVDADERVSPALAAEIQQAMTQSEIAGWQIPRHNYLFGVLTRGAGWYPDYQTRLLRVGSAHYDRSRQVHELVLLDGPLGTLKEPFIHYNYKDLAQFRAKQNKYVQYDAQMLYEQGIKPKFYTYFTQPLRHFWWRFVTLKGYRDGWHGLHLSALMGWYEMRKYWVLRRLRRERA
jgi:(heptosyl)LPS beta-1,4-glucosyltransferase